MINMYICLFSAYLDELVCNPLTCYVLSHDDGT